VSKNSVSRTKNAKNSDKTLLKLVQIEFFGKFGAQKWSKPQILQNGSPIFYESAGSEPSIPLSRSQHKLRHSQQKLRNSQQKLRFFL
jgi:hypothetical protein